MAYFFIILKKLSRIPIFCSKKLFRNFSQRKFIEISIFSVLSNKTEKRTIVIDFTPYKANEYKKVIGFIVFSNNKLVIPNKIKNKK